MAEKNVTPGSMPFKLRPKLIVTVIIVIGVLAMGLSSFYTVDQTEKAVVLRLGKYHATQGPGIQWKLPFGIDQNYNVPIKFQDMYFGYRTESAGVTTIYSQRDFPEESIMLTGDLNIVDIEWSIQYEIQDPRAWLFNVEATDRLKTIRDISQSVINQLVGDRAILDVIGSERENIRMKALEMMNAQLDTYGMGVNVVQLQLQNTRPPEGSVFDAFEDVNKATQDMNRLINEGKEEYNRVIPRAQGQADRMLQEASGYAAQRVNQAEGDVARFKAVYQEYKNNPEVTKTRLYIEMMEDVFGEGAAGTDLIDKDLSNFIPIKNLQGGVQ